MKFCQTVEQFWDPTFSSRCYTWHAKQGVRLSQLQLIIIPYVQVDRVINKESKLLIFSTQSWQWRKGIPATKMVWTWTWHSLSCVFVPTTKSKQSSISQIIKRSSSWNRHPCMWLRSYEKNKEYCSVVSFFIACMKFITRSINASDGSITTLHMVVSVHTEIVLYLADHANMSGMAVISLFGH